jgi:zinc protease
MYGCIASWLTFGVHRRAQHVHTRGTYRMKFLILALAMVVTAHSAEEKPAQVSGVPFVRKAGAISQYRLDSNGLQILLLPEKSAPVVTFMVTYRVGSRNEVTGTTGATHLLEHLMFKGTEKFDRSKGTGFDQVLERAGAETNATTWLDRTNYFATVPANALPLLVEVEADRMRNLALREDDRRPEMVVVRNEFERGENDPRNALDKELWAAAFQAHPYHHDTIGWRSDIERVPIAKLRAFYDTFYWPDNATVTVIGDFDPAAALAEIQKRYGAIPKAPHPIPQIYTDEPEQSGPRRVVVKRGGELGVVAIAHKIPPATHADWPAVQVFSAILAAGKTSRCYRALTDKNLTTEVSGQASFNHDPSLHITTAELTPGTKHDDAEGKLVAEIERIKKDGVTPAEVQTSIAKLLAERAYARDGSFAQAEQINECIAVGDWTLYVSLEEKFKAVTAADVKRVANAYFTERHSVTGWFVPSSEGGAVPEKKEADEKPPLKTVVPAKAPEHALAPPAATHYASDVIREKVAGIDLLLCRTGVKDVVTLHCSIAAGENAAANPALAHLAASMIQRGTKKHDQFAIADMLEKAGVTIEVKVNADTVEFEVKLLRKDVPLVLSLLAEQLRTPALAATELAKAKKQLIAEAQQILEDTNEVAAIAFAQAIFPAGHPSRQANIAELIAAIEKTKLAEVRDFHAVAYGPDGMHLAATGDLDPAAFKEEVTKAFAGWKGGHAPKPAEAPAITSNEKTVQLPDKSSVSVIIGQPIGLRASDPDWLPLNIATGILGRGFTSRLVGNVRDREGLTYGIGAMLAADSFRAGAWFTKATFAPALLERGLASTRREITSWWENGITADELEYRKSAAAGQFTVALETSHGLAEQLLRCAERGLEVSWLDEFPAKIRALTVEQVNAAVKKHLDPAKMVTVKAGTLK